MRNAYRMISTTFFAGTASVALAACGLTEPSKLGTAFMTDLKTANYADAYALVTPSLQQKFGGSAQAMQAQVHAHGQTPTEWDFNNVNVSNGVARLHGSATFEGGVKGAVDMEIVKQDGKWLIAVVSFAK